MDPLAFIGGGMLPWGNTKGVGGALKQHRSGGGYFS